MTSQQPPLPPEPGGPLVPDGTGRPARRGNGVLGSPVGRAAVLMVVWLGLLWVLVAVDAILHDRLLPEWGIVPRATGSLSHLFTAPFLHTGASHLAANSAPLLGLGLAAALTGVRRFLAVTLIVMVVGGLGVWLTGPDHSVTVGASGLIFGYLGYLLLRGFVDRRPTDVLIAVVVGALYGYLLWGVLVHPPPGVSWQGHLFGLIGGLLAALLLRRRRGARSRPARTPPRPS